MGDLSIEKFSVLDADPREELGEETLRDASRNGFPIVAGDAVRRDRGGLMLGGALALALGAFTFFGMSQEKREVPARTADRQEPAPTLPPQAMTVIDEPAGLDAGPALAAEPAATPAILANPPAALAAMQPAPAPVMVFDGSLASAEPGASAAKPGAATPPGAPAGLSDNEAFGSRLGITGAETASASRLADPGHTVTQGTLIPAILETAIDSDLPGYVRALVSEDVRSFDGKRVLVPRSSRLIGQYKSGLAAGQTRAYVMWTRLIRPDGVTVALASPAIEYSGRTGLSGEVDGHFFKRFGAASLLSVVGGLGALASGGASLLITSSTSSAAAVAAQRDAQIPPTIRVRQGQPIRVFTARDLDFSSVAQ